MNLRNKLEQNYDPTDADKAMGVAYAALSLMREVELALENNNANMLLGRDLANQLAVKNYILAEHLGLLDSYALVEEILKFRRLLKDS